MKTVKVGTMPGRIQEYAVNEGTKIADVLRTAELNPSGYEVKVDGVVADPNTAVVTSSTNLILLSKMIKGN